MHFVGRSQLILDHQKQKRVQEAKQRLKENGLICPEITIDHIRIDEETGYPHYAIDLNQDEEKLYHFALRELDKVIDSMLGREDKPMPKTFGVYFDDNFSKEIPQIWYEKSKPIVEQDKNKINNLLNKEESSQSSEQPQKEEIVNIPKEKEITIEDLFDTYSIEDLPETYS